MNLNLIKILFQCISSSESLNGKFYVWRAIQPTFLHCKLESLILKISFVCLNLRLQFIPRQTLLTHIPVSKCIKTWALSWIVLVDFAQDLMICDNVYPEPTNKFGSYFFKTLACTIKPALKDSIIGLRDPNYLILEDTVMSKCPKFIKNL